MVVPRERRLVRVPPVTGPVPRRPVILATLSVGVEPEAQRLAVDSAREAGVPLIVVALFRLPLSLATGILLQADLEAVRETARTAAAAGVSTEMVMLMSARPPARAIARLARDRDAGLVVFGPDRRRTSRRRLRRTGRALCQELDCLVWIADAGGG